ncbi:MAG TPA: MarR family winged helix-turn-helix transcriptional regulator [Caldimonas sp.]|nr:MarR family winged helix-turn-helix transcriptional regulator [Caldimonas sp.]
MSYKAAVSRQEFEALAEFRYRLRHFLRFSEDAARSAGLTPLQYQLLIQVKGMSGRRWALIGELAERLQIAPHGAVSLVTRCEMAGLVTRVASDIDRRQVQVFLTPDGDRLVRRVARIHREELGSLTEILETLRAIGRN